MLVVDTNILIYAVNADAEEHSRCRSMLDDLRKGSTPWYLTWNTIYEFLRVITHARVLRQPVGTNEAWAIVRSFLSSPSVKILSETDKHRSVLETVLSSTPSLRGNILHDVHTAVLMREHGVSKILTRDTDFHRFADVIVIDPLR